MLRWLRPRVLVTALLPSATTSSVSSSSRLVTIAATIHTVRPSVHDRLAPSTCSHAAPLLAVAALAARGLHKTTPTRHIAQDAPPDDPKVRLAFKHKGLKYIPWDKLPDGHPRKGGVKLTSAVHATRNKPAPAQGEGWRDYDVGYRGPDPKRVLPKGWLEGFPMKNRKHRKRMLFRELQRQLDAELRKKNQAAADDVKAQKKAMVMQERRIRRQEWILRAHAGLPTYKGWKMPKPMTVIE